MGGPCLAAVGRARNSTGPRAAPGPDRYSVFSVKERDGEERISHRASLVCPAGTAIRRPKNRSKVTYSSPDLRVYEVDASQVPARATGLNRPAVAPVDRAENE